MGFFAQLEFALLCMDLLAWPVIALVFPLVVSIRAIETGSKYHMRKLVIYWTLFSLLSLFEFAFSEIIQWIPIWSSIKLGFTFWLVFPRFHGACYAYDNFIRPWLVLNLREANMDTKKKHKEPYSSQSDIGVNESGEEHDASALKQVQVATEISKPTSYAAAVTKGILQQPVVEWSCTLCRVESTSETDLNKHLQGRKHKDACESLKSSILGTKQEEITAAVPPQKESSPTQKWRCKLCRVQTTCENNLRDHMRGSKHRAMRESLESSKPNTKQGENKDGPTRHWCFACDVELVGGTSLMSHLNGKRHAANVVANGLS